METDDSELADENASQDGEEKSQDVEETPPFFVPTYKHVVAVLIAYLVSPYILDSIIFPHLPTRVNGFTTTQFAPLKKVFARNFDNGYERHGAAFALYYKGEIVVDLWGGYSDSYSQIPWQNDTLSLYNTATNAIASLCVAVLVDRGYILYDDYVWRYWPEFRVNNKDNITLAMLLSHQAGLVNFQPKLNISHLEGEFHELGEILSRQRPAWAPGTQQGSHMYTLGLYLDQIVWRVDPQHRRLHHFFHDEIAQAFDLDFHLELPLHESHRVARVDEMRGVLKTFHRLWYQNSRRILFHNLLHPNSVSAVALSSRIIESMRYNDPEVRLVPYPSVNGYGTARSPAKLFAILANGGTLNNKTLLGEKTISKLSRALTNEYDSVLLFQEVMGYGMKVVNTSQGFTIFGSNGYGLQSMYADVANNLAWSYTSNSLDDEPRGEHPKYTALVDSLYTCINL